MSSWLAVVRGMQFAVYWVQPTNRCLTRTIGVINCQNSHVLPVSCPVIISVSSAEVHIQGWEFEFWETAVFMPWRASADNLKSKLLNSSCLFVSMDKSAQEVFFSLYRDKSESLCGIQSMLLSRGSLSSWSLWCMRGLSSRLWLCKRHCYPKQWILLEVVR